MTTKITWADFEKVDLRVGRITKADNFPEAKKPAYKLEIDFGPELGVKKSSAQITDYYTREELVGKQVVCVVNFEPKQIGPFVSEVLVTGSIEQDGKVVLLNLDKDVDLGLRIG